MDKTSYEYHLHVQRIAEALGYTMQEATDYLNSAGEVKPAWDTNKKDSDTQK
jgi:hypothetical protein